MLDYVGMILRKDKAMKKIRYNLKKTKTFALCAVMVSSMLAGGIQSIQASSDINVIAQWNFDEKGVKEGSIQNKDLVIQDQSGHGNDLQMNTYGDLKNPLEALSFSSDTMYPGTNGSIQISGNTATKTGADFITKMDAPINSETFDNGYTIEFVYKLPKDWTTAESWMSLMARQGKANTMDEPQLGTMNMAISNCKEIQFLTANKDDSHPMESAAWSVSMDKGDVWYHIALVSDNNVIRTYVNGAEAFRDYVSPEMKGMFADPNDGRFRIGSSWWDEDGKTIDKFARGNYQQVRISEGALDKGQWLISNPEQYLGNYGSNDDFKISNGGTYNMVFLPDTQNTVKFKGNVMDTAIQSLGKNAQDMNIKAIMGLGDIVENWDDTTQWTTAKNIFNKLPKANIPFLIQPGNHDYGGTNYLDAFGPNSEFMQLSANKVINNSPSGFSSYMLYEAGSYQYMMLSLSMNHVTDAKEIEWFEKTLQEHSNVPTIVTSHDIQDCSDTSPNAIELSKNGKRIWNITKQNDQVFMMVGGHNHGAGHEILVNDSGNEVISLLADYQFAYNGGNAFFKFAEFNEAKNKISISTYSPYAASLAANDKTFFDVNYLTGDGNYTDLDFNFTKRFANAKASSSAAHQKTINTLVNDIDALPALTAINLSNKDHIQALKNTFDNLSAKEQKEFSNSQKLLDAYNKIVQHDKMLTELNSYASTLSELSAKKLTTELKEKVDDMNKQLKQGIVNLQHGTLSDEEYALLISQSKTIIKEANEYLAAKPSPSTPSPDNTTSNSNTNTSTTHKEPSVNTGDSMNTQVLIYSLIGSIGAIILFLYYKKRNMQIEK